MKKPNRDVLRGVSDAARAAGCAEQTLRAMEARGVIAPMRDSKGRRLFTESDIAEARTHLLCRRRGMSS